MSVRRWLALSFLQRYVTLAIYMATTIVLARLLSPREIGVYSLCAAFATIAATLREFGISEYLIQERQLTTAKIRSAYGVAISVGWIAGAALLLSRRFIADFYSEPGIVDVLSVLSLNFFLLPLATPAFALLARDMAFGPMLVTQTISTIVGSAVGVYLAWRGHSYMSLAWSAVALTLTQVIAVSVVRPKQSWIMPTFRGARPVWAYCLTYTGTTIIEIASRHSRDFILARQFGFGTVGLYSRAQGLIDQFQSTVTQAITRVVTPALALDNRTGQPLRDRYSQAVGMFTVVAWPFFGFVACSASEIIEVLFGSQWIEAIPLARLLCIGAAVASAWTFAPSVLAALGNVKARLRITMVISPLVLAAYLAGSLVSVGAVALLSAIPALVALLFYTHYLHRLIDFSLGDLARATRISAMVSIGVILPVLAMGFFEPSGFLGLFAYLILKAIVAAILWIMAVVWLRHPLRAELARFTAGLRRKPISK